ncbi:calpastatin [Mycolicibacter heraklionensis]|uniref:Calpastatin n=1 Tax=Mycolicibacter heraklionensis TaxID=512402 RepID=A0ABR5FIT0_9MYCO|nr:DUF1810 domain-containing protein [Mycolicibacter heraklionensis]KLO30806.1 calpastatin [Mycolicibacter heraklionensis]
MAGTSDPFELQRFVDAQAGVYDTVVAELRAGRKRSHWMWFVFPQLAGLGASAMAQRYGIASPAEARAYLAHPVLGPRLQECVGLINAVRGRSIEEILGWPDDMKLRSSMTLFGRACESGGHTGRCCCSGFRTVLDRYYDGQEDPVTLDRLAWLARE